MLHVDIIYLGCRGQKYATGHQFLLVILTFTFRTSFRLATLVPCRVSYIINDFVFPCSFLHRHCSQSCVHDDTDNVRGVFPVLLSHPLHHGHRHDCHCHHTDKVSPEGRQSSNEQGSSFL